ncbi:polyketide cyclase / dehydrase and lipid transport [Mycobacterium sp. CBMA 234]|uniref:SRPBCC family protein n=1 Tax=Mycolicibacterium sp. CBMA 234 TaxID=1918495 RepID=UPI0012DDE75C|nr:SRPBCC family protein [Mycolicibacterium sp. CBMA 234]MUL67803.1 polyketide cyclase / dehydrase and lipid transport [Mycolicibacterium sp. CBMA 234]
MWIVRSRFELREEVPATPDAVRAFYTDLNNMKVVHPLVVAVDCLVDRQDADGRRRVYRVRDRIPFGPLTLSVAYRATVLIGPDGVVHTEAYQFPQVRLSGTVTFTPTAGGTSVTETVDVAAPRPIAAFTCDQAEKAHVAMLAAIRRQFEGQTDQV